VGYQYAADFVGSASASRTPVKMSKTPGKGEAFPHKGAAEQHCPRPLVMRYD
jgi:hypothetical protein